MLEHFTFANDAKGTEHAWLCALWLRKNGHKTRLVSRQWGMTTVQTVVSTPPSRPTRKERGCAL